VDACVVEPFTRELASRSADDFVASILAGAIGAREVVVGYDFTYGTKRQGNVETLRTDGLRRDFAVHVVPAVTVDGLVASSTKIREFVLEGKVEGAAVLLGRDFAVEGTVVRGAGRGRTIGIPTANVRVENEILPRPGIYAARVTILDAGTGTGTGTGTEVRPAVVNLGTNPTFVADGALSLEAHLLDFDGDLYDRRLRVGFVARLRDEERFASVDALVAQIRRDIDEGRKRLSAR
jgi:riboflavin kinase / FMN adenylyltransferase